MKDLDALRLALPGIARRQPMTAEDVETIGKKAELRDCVARLGLSNRRAALRLGMHESTLRGLCDPRALNRCPDDSVLERVRDLVEAGALAIPGDAVDGPRSEEP